MNRKEADRLKEKIKKLDSVELEKIVKDIINTTLATEELKLVHLVFVTAAAELTLEGKNHKAISEAIKQIEREIDSREGTLDWCEQPISV